MLARKVGAGTATQAGSDEAEDEAALVARVAVGEAQAFRALVDRHLPTVLAIARRMLRDDAEAEDVAEETLLRLWRNAAGSSWARAACGLGCGGWRLTCASTGCVPNATPAWAMLCPRRSSRLVR